MTFDEALKAMRMGSKVSREKWRGRIKHWSIGTLDNAEVLFQTFPDGSTKALALFLAGNILADDWWTVT